jgi:uncharacterized coiled-coil DUF342 family protein
MYATEKHLKMEAKELRDSLNQLAADLGNDIVYLNEQITELRSVIQQLQQEIEQVVNRSSDE